MILNNLFLDFSTHHVKSDTQCQEYQAKDCEGYHGGLEAGNGSPGWKSLLLEFGASQLLNFLSDFLFFFFGLVHFILANILLTLDFHSEHSFSGFWGFGGI